MLQKLKPYLTAPVSAAPLAVFRIVFGGMMLASILRFMGKGWVTELYVQPKVYFPYYGFEWVKPWLRGFANSRGTCLSSACGWAHKLTAY